MSKDNTERKSFVLYVDYLENLEMLSDSEKGRLFNAIFLYVRDGVIPDFEGALKMAFVFISKKLDRDWQKYQDISKKRREAGRKGGQAPRKAEYEEQEDDY